MAMLCHNLCTCVAMLCKRPVFRISQNFVSHEFCTVKLFNKREHFIFVPHLCFYGDTWPWHKLKMHDDCIESFSLSRKRLQNGSVLVFSCLVGTTDGCAYHLCRGRGNRKKETKQLGPVLDTREARVL